jgi:hypothetical protein
MATKMEEKTDKLNKYKVAISELQRIYDHVSNSFDQLRVKTLALIAGEVAIVSFIFSGDQTLVPTQTYGKILLGLGLSFMAVAFTMFLWTISSMPWLIPVTLQEVEDIDERYEDTQAFLKFVKKDYIECINHCMKKVEPRAKRFDTAIYLLMLGVIIVLVIKFGGIPQ